MRALTVRGWGTLATVLVLAGVVIAAAFAVGHRPSTPVRLASAAGDPLSAELAYCRGLGEAGERDPHCHAAWEQLRRHFFGQDRKAAGHE
jgi:conjugative transfer region protein TrbK